MMRLNKESFGPSLVRESIIRKRPRADSAPLSFAQLQMWLMDQVSPGNPAYGLPVAYRLKGRLDLEVLENSLNEIIRRHEVLRTTFTVVDGEPQQQIHPACEIKIRTIGLDHLTPQERDRRLLVLTSAEAVTPFDLANLPLIRVLLFRISGYENILLINLHHILADGISLRLILEELDRLYQKLPSSDTHGLPALPIQYGDFSAWQRETIADQTHAAEISFWRQVLDNAPPALELPVDFQRPVSQSFKGSNIFFEIPAQLARELEDLGAREGCTPFTTLFAAFQVLLHRYSGADDLVIGTPLSMRMPASVQPLIGNFLNTIPLRCDLSGNPTFVQVLHKASLTTVRAFSKASFPFEKIIENVRFRRDPSRNPIFQAMIEVLPAMNSRIGDLEVENFYFDLGFSQFDLTFHAWKELQRYACRFEYCTSIFRADTIQRMAANFGALLSSVVADPKQRIGSIPILTESEKAQLLVGWNRTDRPYPIDSCLHHLIEATAAKNPSQIAIEFGDQAITYGELDRNANQLANYLITSGVKAEELVGLCVERSPDLIIGLLGILKAGAAYVPLDPMFPRERLARMIEDAGVSIIVTQADLQRTLPPGQRRHICLDSDREKVLGMDATNPGITLSSSNLAYTIYTSGSSGKPKGVMIEHRSLVNCLVAMQREPGFDHRDVMVAVTTISFDIAGLEMFLPLICGGKLIIASRNEASSGLLLAQLLRRTRATVLQATPSSWKLLIDADWRATPTFKMLCGGEALSRDLANQLLERGGELWNMYGPTETTIWSAVHKVQSTSGTVPVGPPIANTEFYIVDERLDPVPIGVPGELLIGGDGLARGYLNRPDLTSERFVMTRLAGSEKRVYKTGDLVRYRSAGDIEFLGRRDSQVKVRGYRIELEEIEHVLAKHGSVKEVAVVAYEDPDGDKRIVAYYISHWNHQLSAGELRQYVRQQLPEYMCPSFFVELQAFPLTPNGKIDRKAFPAPCVAAPPDLATRATSERPLDTQLTALWEEVLKQRPIGLDDNFFELGGHSLLAARLFVQIEKKLGVKLPLATLFHSPTVRSLADKIEQRCRPSDWNSLVPIQTRGSRPPLFLVHGAEGNVLLYRSLSECLGQDQPLYGLQSQGLDGGDLFDGPLENLATKYLDEIRSVQPTGPYYLGGYCLGGTIAFEMARQLKRDGESVALLAMIETYNMRSRPPASQLLKVFHKAENLYFQSRNLVFADSSIQFFVEKARVELSRIKVRWESLRGRIGDLFRSGQRLGYQHLRIREANHHKQEAYVPLPYAGKVILFKPRTHYRQFNDPFFGWKPLVMQGVEVIEMPYYPRASLNQPFVMLLARALRAEIQKALEVEKRLSDGETDAQPPVSHTGEGQVGVAASY